MTDAVRSWCATLQYPSKEQVLFGTIVCDSRAAMHEVERDMESAINGCLPDGYKLIDLVPGELIFQPETEGTKC